MRDGLPEPGDVIAQKYEVTALLGRGGMGSVYAVTHRLTGHRLAVKCLLPRVADNPVHVERFLREARAVGRIHHRNVIDVLDVGTDGPLRFIVLPLLTGKLLSSLYDERTLSPERVLTILLRTMRGVAAAHAAGIIHRDLKPANVFVCEGLEGELDEPRVLDFGISKLSGEHEMNLTVSGIAVGTPFYMPPEQLAGARDVDARADVYAVGVMLYEGLTHALPHVADNVVGLALSMLHTTPRRPRDHRPELPAGLDAVVMRALARERAERYANMEEFIAALAPFVSLAGHSDSRSAAPDARPSQRFAAPSADTQVEQRASALALSAAAAATGSADTATDSGEISAQSGGLAWAERGRESRELQRATSEHARAVATRPTTNPALRRTTLWLVVGSGVLVLAAGLVALSARHRVPNLPPALPVPIVRTTPPRVPQLQAAPAQPAAAAPPATADASVNRAPITPAPRASAVATARRAPQTSAPQPGPSSPAPAPAESESAPRPSTDSPSAPSPPAVGPVMPRGGVLHRDEF